MSIVRYFRKIQFIDSLIRRRATGNQAEFARKTHMSKSMLKEYLKEMKELGFPINFCRQSRTYYYEEEGKMVDVLFTKSEVVDMKTYKGGKQFLINISSLYAHYAVTEQQANYIGL